MAELEERLADQDRQRVAQRAELEERLADQERQRATERAELVGQLAAQREEITRLRTERGHRTSAAPASPLILPAKFGRRGTTSDDAASQRANGRHTSRRGLLKLGGAVDVIFDAFGFVM
jgi:hypothetical protein